MQANFEFSVSHVVDHARNGEYFQITNPEHLTHFNDETIPGHWVSMGRFERFVRYILSSILCGCVLTKEEEAARKSLANLIICAKGVSNVAITVGIEIFDLMKEDEGSENKQRLKFLLTNRIGNQLLQVPAPTLLNELRNVQREMGMRVQHHLTCLRSARDNLRPVSSEENPV